jgi:hypothetical protein
MDIVYWIVFALMCSFYVGVWLLTSGCERRFVADPHRYVPNCDTIVVRRPSTVVRTAVAVRAPRGMSPVPASEGGRS